MLAHKMKPHLSIFISIVYSCVDIPCGVMTFFSVSRSHLLDIIAGGGITLDFLCGLKAKNATAPRIQKKCIVGFIPAEKIQCEIYATFHLRRPFKNEAFG